MHAALHHYHRITLAGFTLGNGQALAVFAAILEFQGIQRLHFGTDLKPTLGIQQPIQAGACGDAVMMVAFGADTKVFFQVGVVQYCLTGRAFVPQALGHIFFALRAQFTAIDFWRQ